MNICKVVLVLIVMAAPVWAQPCNTGLFFPGDVMDVGEVVQGEPVELGIEILFTRQLGTFVVTETGAIEYIGFDRELPVGRQGNFPVNINFRPTGVGPQTAQFGLNIVTDSGPCSNPGLLNISYVGLPGAPPSAFPNDVFPNNGVTFERISYDFPAFDLPTSDWARAVISAAQLKETTGLSAGFLNIYSPHGQVVDNVWVSVDIARTRMQSDAPQRQVVSLVSGYGLGNIRQVIWNERVECDLKIYRFEF